MKNMTIVTSTAYSVSGSLKNAWYNQSQSIETPRYSSMPARAGRGRYDRTGVNRKAPPRQTAALQKPEARRRAPALQFSRLRLNVT
jgi:hypothetical protein